MSVIIYISWKPPGNYTGGSYTLMENFMTTIVNNEKWFFIDNNVVNSRNAINYSFVNFIYGSSLIRKILSWLIIIPIVILFSVYIIHRKKIKYIFHPIGDNKPLSVAVYLVSLLTNCKIIGLIHQHRTMYQVSKKHNNIAKRYINIIIERTNNSIQKRYYKIITVSEDVQKNIKLSFGGKSKVILPGIEELPLLTESKKIYDALYLGRITATKGCEQLIEVW